MKRRPPQLDPPVLRRRSLTAQEALLWKSVMEQGVAHRKPSSEPAAKKAEPEPLVKKPVKKAWLTPHALDSATRAKIRKGKTAIDGTLDLHGHTVDTAQRMLVKFVAKMQKDSVVVVLVITGKGRAPQSGILRAQLPHWLEVSPLREQVSSFSLAGKDHGGDGAWYIRIRKRSV